MAVELGTSLGHYDVTALIGEGGMGQVYQATDTKLNQCFPRPSAPVPLQHPTENHGVGSSILPLGTTLQHLYS